MKVKKLLSVLGLGLFAAVSVGAGVALNKGAKAEAVKADDPKTWMMRFQFNAGSASQHYPGTFENRFNGASFHCWGDDFDIWAPAEKMFEYSDQDYYGVNVSFTDSQVVKGAQWKVSRDDAGDAYSVDIGKFGAYDNYTLTKDSPYLIIGWTFGEDWQGDKFKFYSEYGSQTTNDILLEWEGGGAGSFDQDPENNVFIFSNYSPNKSPSYISARSDGYTVTLRENLRAMVTPESWRYLTKGGSDYVIYLATEGYYDFVLGNGSFAVKKHEDPHNSYIYYVSDKTGDDPTTNNIYAWDELGNQQFGPWEGASIATIAEDVTGVVKFEGSFKRIYKIPVQTGYPTGVNSLIFNGGGSQSSAFPMIDGAAYWWEGGANVNAGASLDLIFRIEELRNAVTAEGDIKDYSICGISSTDAAEVVGKYNDLNEDSRNMVNSSTTKTYAGKGTDVETDISFRNIVIELGKIANVEVTGASRTISGNNGVAQNVDSTTLIAIISVICLVSISSIVVLIVVKKRKHQ